METKLFNLRNYLTLADLTFISSDAFWKSILFSFSIAATASAAYVSQCTAGRDIIPYILT
jgi:hypothetical protein